MRGAKAILRFLLIAGGLLTPPAFAATHYVNGNNAAPVSPYTNWAGAARTIQNAIEASAHGDLILVTNGVYNTGGRTFKGPNRVALTRRVIVQSVNGPAGTIILGQRAFGTTNGVGAIRCAYLTNGAMLIGFTLTNGATRTDGDVLVEQSGGGVYCESTEAAVYNCMMIGNSAYSYGAGAYSGTLSNCTVIGNWAGNCGGGAAEATMSECALRSNSANYGAGGAYGGTLSNCTLTANSAGGVGGAAAVATLNKCTLTGNSAHAGGGAFDCTLKNCVISGNSASDSGGGATSGTLYNCIVTGNSAPSGGGTSDWPGYASPKVYNSIVYYNTAPRDPNYTGSIFNHSCTTPFPESGIGNFVIEPELASASHLSANSPCIGRGSYSLVSGVDIDGQAWANPPSIGCDEFYSGSATGAVTVGLSASFTNVAPGFSVNFQGFIAGHASASRWEFGDGTVVSNRPYASHAWSAVGDYPVVLRVYNDSFPAGVTATNIIHIVKGEYYVARDNATPAFPYTSWATAATNIQDAVDAASVPGAAVVVTNGVYQTGGRAVTGGMTNRVVVDKPLTVRSINGPQFTIIRGYQEPGSPYGDNSIRCAYLADGAMLAGFTLTNGATRSGGFDSEAFRVRSGGGVNCESTNAILTNCVLAGNSAHSYGGGIYSGTLLNCTLSGNRAYSGGGANSSTMYNCSLIANSAEVGGGGATGTLNDCLLSGNFAGIYGGGMLNGTLNHCTLTANMAYEGGGIYGSTMNNCSLTGNSASIDGGGAVSGTLNNCELTGNSASEGGGASSSTLNNCTITGNSASLEGGGVIGGALTNCIVYYNAAPAAANYLGGTLNYSCTIPLPNSGVGNLDSEPELASSFRLSASSPCIGRGTYAGVSGMDIDGEPWANPPSIGCDEFYSGSAVGPITVSVVASYTNVAAGFSVTFQGFIAGHVSASRWEFGDGTVVSNRPSASHAWNLDGDYPVVLRAYNDSFPEGITATVMIHVVSAVHYVALDSAAPTPPYVSWETAATNIQDAVDAASTVGALVLVTNGVYHTGGRAVFGTMTNRVAVDKPLSVRSVNGAEFTVIQGYQVPEEQGDLNGEGAIRCVYLTNSATLSGFTITNGATQAYGDYERDTLGGGIWCESTRAIVSDCVISGNSAHGGGGGAYSGTLKNCSLTGNSGGSGGAASSSMLTNCNLSGNFAQNGGGSAYCELNNCRLSSNWANNQGGGAYGGTLNHSVLTGNSATNAGGGAQDCTLNHCTLSENRAAYGAGSAGGALYHCTLTANRASQSGGGSSGATLIECAINGNSADYSGGGVYGGSLSNCTVSGNFAEFGGGAFIPYSWPPPSVNSTLTGNWAYWAGGVYGGTFANCTVADNSAFWAGGAYYSALTNCTVTGNSADFSGGAYYGTLENCIAVFNNAVVGENYLYSTLNYSCTVPLPTNGVGNISTDPLFADYYGGNLRLQSNSPCINSGRNAVTTDGLDLDGNPRVAGGTVDIGAYEFQAPLSLLSYAWLQQFGLPADGSADYADPDGDKMNNFQEWVAGTIPTNSLSVLRMLNPLRDASGITVTWQSVTNQTYFIERATNLGAFSAWLSIVNIPGKSGTTSYTDTNVVGSAPFFYRVGTQP